MPLFISAIFSSAAKITFDVNQTPFTLSFPYTQKLQVERPILTWVGKLTYLRASYWHHELMMLEKEQ